MLREQDCQRFQSLSQTVRSWIPLKWMELQWSTHAENLALEIKYSLYKSECELKLLSFRKRSLFPKCNKRQCRYSYRMLATRIRPTPCHARTWGNCGCCWQGRHHGITISIRCIPYIRRSLAIADSALSLYPGSSPSVEDSLPKRWDTLLWLHLSWAAHMPLTKLSRGKPGLSTSALSGCRIHRPLVLLRCLML